MVASKRNPKTGGRIPPQGRTPQAKGVGKNAKRHDLERPATPGLSDSTLQKGDVQQLEQGQAIAPRAGAKRVQGPAQVARGATQGGTAQQGGVTVPDPIEFAKGRLGNTLTGAPSTQTSRLDPTPWMPFLRALVSTPGAGGALTQAFIVQLSNIVNRPSGPQQAVINMDDLDKAVAESLGA